MGRRAVDPALALSRTVGISVLVAEHETWLQMPMPERRRISLVLRQVLRQELGFGAQDLRAQLQAPGARTRPAHGTSRKRGPLEPIAGVSRAEVSPRPTGVPPFPPEPAPVPVPALAHDRSALESSGPAGVEPALDLDGWV